LKYVITEVFFSTAALKHWHFTRRWTIDSRHT